MVHTWLSLADRDAAIRTIMGEVDKGLPVQMAFASGIKPKVAAEHGALGCLIYECLAGEPPFARGSRLAVAWAHLEEEPPRATDRRPG